jgi:hypothetical protein
LDHSRYLARLARCDPSRLGLDASRTKQWLLARDEWEIICPLCIHASLNAGTPAYERALWRLATCTFCSRHRSPLIQINSLSQVVSHIDHYESQVLVLTDLEQVVSAQLFEFEREIARAFHGIAPSHFGETLTAADFLHVLNDLITFAVGQWEADITHRVASSLDQHASLLKHHCAQLFDCRRPRRLSYRRSDQAGARLSQIADPATRRAALWLVMQVIRLPPTPRPTHALHLGHTAQDDFFGNKPHAGWSWLATQAKAWPRPYRVHFWEGFSGDDDSFKGTSDINEGTGRVEDWRADFRLRWVFHRFRGGPQSGCHDHVSSPRRIERSVRVSRTRLTCSFRATVYGTYSTETTFRRSRRNR